MSKILIVATSRKTRGGITSVIKAHEKGQQWNEFQCHWIQTHRDGSNLRKLSYFFSALIDYIIRLPFYDIVHLHISQPTTIKRKKIFLQLAKLFNKKVITHFHAFNTDDTINGQAGIQYQNFFEKSDIIIVLSNWWKEQLSKNINIPSTKISVLYNPCPIIQRHDTKQDNIILYAGAVNERKGYNDLLKAFGLIKEKIPEWKVVFAGNGEIEKGKALSRQLGIESQVEFTGWVTGKEKEKLFRRAKIFCLPSYAEGFPMAVLEAWSYGLPVITTPVGGIPDVAKDGENMLLFNSGDIFKLAENIEKLIANKDLYDKISNASSEFADGPFNIQTINKQLAEIYRSLDNNQ